MSKEALAKVVQHAISDGAFRRQLSTDPTGALRGYDLSGDETAAIRSGDAGRLSSLGVDQRMSKAFSMGGDGDAVTRLSPSDISSTVTAIDSGADSGLNAVQRFELGGAGAASNGLVTGATADEQALISGDDAGMNAVQRFELGGAGAASNAISYAGDEPAGPSVFDPAAGASHDAFAGGVTADGNALDPGDVDPSRILGDDTHGGGAMPGDAHGGPDLQQ
jgi:hypothetical protein